ncbi:MAG: hypothetical protein ACRC0G_04515 [Fusobacteriaceae bacterium]
MDKVAKIKNVFSLGEISPDLYHRYDLAQYDFGLAFLKNGIAKVGGTIVSSPEIVFRQSFSNNGSGKRWFKYNNDDTINKKCVMVLITTTMFTFFTVDENYIFAKVKEIGANYTEAELDILSITQIENTILVCCKGKKPQMIKLNESDFNNIVLVDYWEAITEHPVKSKKTEFANVPKNSNIAQWHKDPYGNKVTIKIEPKDPLAPLYSESFISSVRGGQISLFGNLFRIEKFETSGNNQTIEMTAIEGEGIAPPTNKLNEALDPPKYEDVWEYFDIKKISFFESLFQNNQYPALCSYYQGRVVFANIKGNPDFVCFSRTGDYFNFTGNTNLASSGFALAIPSDERVVIKKIINFNSLLFVSENGVWSTPILQSLTPVNSFMSRQIIPNISFLTENYTLSQGNLYYINDSNNKVYSLIYSSDSKMYGATEVSVYSRHMLKKIENINMMKYEGNEYIYCSVNVKENCICTINEEQNVTSWSRYVHEFDYKLINIENKTLFIKNNGSGFDICEISDTIYKSDMELKLLPPRLGEESRYINEFPYIAKQGYQYTDLVISVIGNYDLEVNEDNKTIPFGVSDFTTPKNVKFDIVKAGCIYGNVTPINIKNKNNNKVEISAIYYAVESEKEMS